MSITALDEAGVAHHLDALAEILRACVHAGASVNFVLPFEIEDARAFWRDKVAPGLRTGTRVLLLASVEGQPAGTVQLGLDTPPNQAHRADVAKLLVHPRFRGLGLGRALMLAIEARAAAADRRLLTLDTADSFAEALYASLGYRRAGAIPDYAKHPFEDRWEATILMFKTLPARR